MIDSQAYPMLNGDRRSGTTVQLKGTRYTCTQLLVQDYLGDDAGTRNIVCGHLQANN